MIFTSTKPQSSFVIEIDGCDMECKGITGTYGYLEVSPEMFDWKKISRDESVGGFFYEGTLNEAGWKHIGPAIKHSSRGFIHYSIITKSKLIEKRKELNTIIKYSNYELNQINNILNK